MEAAGLYPAEIYMGLTEILLIVMGIAIFAASFIIPENFPFGNQHDRIFFSINDLALAL